MGRNKVLLFWVPHFCVDITSSSESSIVWAALEVRVRIGKNRNFCIRPWVEKSFCLSGLRLSRRKLIIHGQSLVLGRRSRAIIGWKISNVLHKALGRNEVLLFWLSVITLWSRHVQLFWCASASLGCTRRPGMGWEKSKLLHKALDRQLVLLFWLSYFCLDVTSSAANTLFSGALEYPVSVRNNYKFL